MKRNKRHLASDFDDFVEKNAGRIESVARSYLGDRELSREIAQETLMRAWSSWSRVGQLDRPDAWCFRVASNLAKSALRRRKVARRQFPRVPTSPSSTDGSYLQESCWAALAGLDKGQRGAIVLRFIVDLSVTETAKVLGVPEGTVKSMTSRGLDRLRTIIEKELTSDG